jgi:diacylglycerol kinase family enzyme
MRSQSIYKGTHIGDGRTTHLRGKKFRVELVNERAASTFLLDVDGEPLGRLPLEIEVVPSRVHVRA